MPIRVLVIDDSPTMRAVLTTRLVAESDIDVVGSAANAAEGREMIKRLDPDVVTLDIEMPGMNGLDFLEKIMALRPTPVIIVSGTTQRGSEVTARALTLGAIDCYAKSDGTLLNDGGKLAELVRAASTVRFGSRAPARSDVGAATPVPLSLGREPALIAIGASTGGVEALQTMVKQFPADCPPTVIVQHVNERFAPAIAKTLDLSCAAHVQLAEPDIPLRRGNIYLAPGGDRHLLVGGQSSFHALLRNGPPVNGHVPSVDALFLSVARTVGKNAIGVLLTGMGSDGAMGLLAMANAGARTIAQDEATCTVFGMPRAAIELGAAEAVVPLPLIVPHLMRRAA